MVTAGITAGQHPPAAPLLGRRLRVGYVSADFREHPLSHLMQGLFRHHDRFTCDQARPTLFAKRRLDENGATAWKATPTADLPPIER